MLLGAHLISSRPSDPGNVSWIAGKAVLVFTGDYIDKGKESLHVLSLLRALQAAAARAGGRVVLLMGNHEAEFLADPNKDKVSAFAAELSSAGMSPGTVAACQGDMGEFLCSLPFAARVNDWFLSHAGNSSGRTLHTLADDLQTGVDRDGFASEQLIGPDSILEARLGKSPWFNDPGSSEEKTLRKYTSALGVSHIVQGHQPKGVRFSNGECRKAGEMFQRYGLIFLEDTGMSNGVNDSDGAVLHIEAQGRKAAVAICPDGGTTVLWDPQKSQSLGRAKPCGRRLEEAAMSRHRR